MFYVKAYSDDPHPLWETLTRGWQAGQPHEWAQCAGFGSAVSFDSRPAAEQFLTKHVLPFRKEICVVEENL